MVTIRALAFQSLALVTGVKKRVDPPLPVTMDWLQGIEEIPVRLLGLKSGAYTGSFGFVDPSTLSGKKFTVTVPTDGVQRRFPGANLY